MSAVKIATSVPAAQFEALETVRARLGIRRSTAVQQALALWLTTNESNARVAEYVQGYLTNPDETTNGDSLAQAWVEGLESEEWR